MDHDDIEEMYRKKVFVPRPTLNIEKMRIWRQQDGWKVFNKETAEKLLKSGRWFLKDTP